MNQILEQFEFKFVLFIYDANLSHKPYKKINFMSQHHVKIGNYNFRG